MVCRLHIVCVFALGFALNLAALTPVNAEIYRWVDNKGQTHFGNVPPNPLKVYKPGFSALDFDPTKQQLDLTPHKPAQKIGPNAASAEQVPALLKASEVAPTAKTSRANPDVNVETHRVNAGELKSLKPVGVTEGQAEKNPSDATDVVITDEKCGIFNLFVGDYEEKLRTCNGNVCEQYARQLERYRNYLRRHCR